MSVTACSERGSFAKSPMNVSAAYENVASLHSLQWVLLCPWTSQQLSHFWIPKEPDELRDWPHKGFRKGYNAAILFALLTNCVPDPIKCPARGPKMLRVFKGRIAKTTLTWIFVDFNAVSSEPSMSSEELNEITYSWATIFHDTCPFTRSWKPLFGLICIW